MALKHHPDRNNSSEASSKAFKEVSEAYEVLSDSNKRAVYDEYGEAGLKSGGGAGGGAGAPGGFNPFGGGGNYSSGGPGASFSFGGMPGGAGGFSPSNPEDIFASLFGGGGGGQNPFASMGGGHGAPGGFPGMGGAPGGFPGMGGMGSDGGDPFSGGPSRAKPKSIEIIKPLALTLSELYNGTTKKLKITKLMRDGSSGAEVVTVTVKRGWKDGTKIKFAGAGGEGAVRLSPLGFHL